VSAEQIAADLGVGALDGSGGAGMQGEGVWQPAADPFAPVSGADAVLLLTAVADASAARAAGLRVWVVGEGEG
jgi:UDPglucose 6-dehydrogenase